MTIYWEFTESLQKQGGITSCPMGKIYAVCLICERNKRNE